MHGQELGDYMGVESCIDFRPELPPTPSHRGRSCRRRPVAGKQFPPPIPPSHLAWGMRKYYTSDGRLVIMEEKVSRRECFRAHRSNGRLVLHLVPFEHSEKAISGEESGSGDGGSGYPMADDECYKCDGVGVRPGRGFGAVAATAAAFRATVHT